MEAANNIINVTNNTIVADKNTDTCIHPTVKFYIIDIPELTYELIYTNPKIRRSTYNINQASLSFYQSSINEYNAEVWLHCGFDNMSKEQRRTIEPNEAYVFLLPTYLHLYSLCFRCVFAKRSKSLENLYWDAIIATNYTHKPHLILSSLVSAN